MDTSNQPAEPDFFRQDPQAVEAPHVPTVANPSDSVSWTASEFLQHQKSAMWYLSAIGVLLVLAVLSYFVTRDYIGSVAVAVLGALLLVVAGRKPRTIQYVVDAQGIMVGNREYIYDEFQSFTIIKEDQIEYIALYPQKRLAPEISMYFAPDDGQKIFDILSSYLPFEQREKDSIDMFLHKIKF